MTWKWWAFAIGYGEVAGALLTLAVFVLLPWFQSVDPDAIYAATASVAGVGATAILAGAIASWRAREPAPRWLFLLGAGSLAAGLGLALLAFTLLADLPELAIVVAGIGVLWVGAPSLVTLAMYRVLRERNGTPPRRHPPSTWSAVVVGCVLATGFAGVVHWQTEHPGFTLEVDSAIPVNVTARLYPLSTGGEGPGPGPPRCNLVAVVRPARGYDYPAFTCTSLPSGHYWLDVGSPAGRVSRSEWVSADFHGETLVVAANGTLSFQPHGIP
ncbi:MAG: hypothetical protein ACYDBQ_02905 [Thermoplasmatota archaeon]